MKVVVTRDYEEMSKSAAGIVSEAVQAKPDLKLCLPTGSTPKGMYRELIRLHRERRLDFSRVSFFQLDEYAGLRADHAQSFRAYLWREFLNYVNARRTNVYLIDEDYEETIQRQGGIDMLVSGIGINGHIAFNEPGSSFDSRTRLVELAETTVALMRKTFSPEELPHQAITMGLATILEAQRILLLASGTAKARVLARALGGSLDAEVPASVLQGHPNITVLADESAAAIYLASHGEIIVS